MMLSSRLLRQPVVQLAARSSAVARTPVCRPLIRAFHASAARQGSGLDTMLYLPHELMSLIHANVPWYAAIPLTAFIVRGALVTTFGAWARSLVARYVGLQPLRQALAFQKRDEILRTGNFRSPKEAIAHVKEEVKQITTALDKRWNVSIKGQLGWTLLQLPIFFAMAEAIRQKCGARDGLLGLGASLIRDARDGLAGWKASLFGTKDAALGAGESAVQSVSGIDDFGNEILPAVNNLVTSPTTDIIATSTPNISDMAAAQSQWFDPSLASEGMLWFPDLIVPDPTGVLPFLVSGLMFSNIYFTKNNVPSGPSWQTALRRTLLAISLLVGPICQDLPAAMMLYWASSTSSVIIWNWWLDWRYPAPSGFTACKRALLMPPTPAPKGRRL